MRSISSGLLLIVALLLFTTCSPPRDPRVDRIDSLFAGSPDFSGVALVAEKGRPIYFKAFGYRDFNVHSPMDTAAIFELASVTKQFTAMTIMILKQEGKLNYDDLINQYVPGLPYEGITIRHLLTHTSGLPDYQAIMDMYWDKTKAAGNPEIIEYLIRYHPSVLFAPGEKYEYSNTGYMLLATIVEKVSGQEFVAFCKTRIFVPLQMTSTDIRTLDQKITLENMAWGHVLVPEEQFYQRADSFPSSNYTIWLGNRKGPGRISSTASDLLKWDRALYGETIITQETLKEGFTPFKLNNDSLSQYGFGWNLGRNPVMGPFVGHGGDNPGYRTHILRYTEADKTVIMMTNNYHRDFDRLINAIVKVIGENR